MATDIARAELDLPPTDLPSEDGIPMETPWHYYAMTQLIDSLAWFWRDRPDWYVGGNMFLYFSVKQARNQDYRGPDFFAVKGVDRYRERRYWAVWDEDGRFPNVIVELLSPSTAEIDRTVKKRLYEQTFHTGNYFCCDPDAGRIEGWQLREGIYEQIAPDPKGRLWSDELDLWLGMWRGTFRDLSADWPRFFTPEGKLVPTAAEGEHHHAEAERHRADTLQAENERLRRELETLRSQRPNP